MYIVNLTQPFSILTALMFTVLFIILGREFKKSILPAVALFIFLGLILMHVFQMNILTDAYYKAIVTKSMITDAIMIFLLYISYLWIDDIEAREENKRSINESLEWFWKKV